MRIVYTPVSNLRKENGFDIGQVSFHSTKHCRYTTVQKKHNDIVNRLNKTKEERVVDFAADRLARQREDRERKRNEETKAKVEREKEEKKKREEAELMSYSSVMKSSSMSSNKHDEPVDINTYEEDFFG